MAKQKKEKTKKQVSVKNKKKKLPVKKQAQRKNTLVEQLTTAVVEGMEAKKAQEIVIIDLRETGNSVTDFFVICHGSSNVQIEAIARSVEETVEKMIKEKPIHAEGKANAQWILLEYFNVLVHIFSKSAREFYNIESLWADGKMKLASAT